MIDTLRPVSLPEGVEVTLRLAGPIARGRAWLIDFGVRLVVSASTPALFSLLGAVGEGILLVFMFALWTLYPVLFEVLWHGATPGKRVCGLAVVHADGTPVGWPASFLRNVMRFADMMPFAYLVGFVTMLLDPQFRRLGDLAAGTVVIHVEPAARTAKARASVAPVAPPVALTPLEQRAVLDYAERRGTWSEERAAEIAEIAAPLVAEARGPEAAARVSAIAAGLVERR